MADFSKPPSSSQLTIKPFKAHVDQQAIDDFKTLLRLSPVSNATYENSHPSVAGPRRYGKFMGMSNAFIAFPPLFLPAMIATKLMSIQHNICVCVCYGTSLAHL